ncbi:hypothetical protein G6F46_006076 [Rhizopus delemar]|uniref:Reverse transcriptase domain-containing protein n=2 Tax=Rhizopus TaxID=4842 RepID=A0A9P6Z394_9FUNG|nr:hypothetical protein G6F55_005210 [Rhizopus delemar]KAG1543628.1 hypothetical protein G6F51_006558 [Rhizopus arrhizus]KAG1497207.1 hypothetical protein G6F54_005924 [Rhizopus delemar]KAG1511056.1 hypothetical protein G6F53_006223 [Rhizopus delemar]KAG1518283.1 hypothetical protein G6F52_009056 [Rhizopus delemar]
MAFDLAIKPYIVANQRLNKNLLCNITEVVLYLPTPPKYVANIKQYSIPYTLQPKVMEIINNWIEDGIIVPAKPSAWNLPMTFYTIECWIRFYQLTTIYFPLIDDISNPMSNAVVFSTLDLKSSFNQFPVYGSDQIKATFTAPNNLQYMYRGAPLWTLFVYLNDANLKIDLALLFVFNGLFLLF